MFSPGKVHPRGQEEHTCHSTIKNVVIIGIGVLYLLFHIVFVFVHRVLSYTGKMLRVYVLCYKQKISSCTYLGYVTVHSETTPYRGVRTDSTLLFNNILFLFFWLLQIRICSYHRKGTWYTRTIPQRIGTRIKWLESTRNGTRSSLHTVRAIHCFGIHSVYGTFPRKLLSAGS